ncbi:MAG: hypothetical protein OEV58_12005 [Gammaproteobacteria bacterium]|nr:hypothetical protein [Gammaproteobacteria bacterium]MDH5262422.1 hypothetical protein [Gammaproteobacteria bacterium]
MNRPLAPGNAGALRRKPTPGRPCTAARVVMNSTEPSDQAIARRWRSARVCRIDGLRGVALGSPILRQRLASVRGKVGDIVEEQHVAREISVREIFPLIMDEIGDIELVLTLVPL